MSLNSTYKSVEYKWGEDEITVDVGITAQEIDNMLTVSDTYTMGAQGSAGSYTISTGASGSWNTNPYIFNSTGIGSVANISGSGLHVTSDAKFDGDIKWKGRSLGDMLTTIEKRLAILTPDPAKLEHFEALQKAYQHYKTLEALCEIPEKKDDGS
jgi:hypothetical protein